ncbi:MAG: Rrf2 family transcriptional regulator [Deltaproteobacteria bacterium]|nr:Rrf2 family transcriptional regulator [Deltaproteobacteria bacterium]
MYRLSKKADYGLIALKHLTLAASDDAVSANEISRSYNMPQKLLAKVMQKMAQKGILNSQAGANGGYTLARAPDKITVFDVIEAVEGKSAIVSCGFETGKCDNFDLCMIRDPLKKVNERVFDILFSTTISELCRKEDSNEAANLHG